MVKVLPLKSFFFFFFLFVCFFFFCFFFFVCLLFCLGFFFLSFFFFFFFFFFFSEKKNSDFIRMVQGRFARNVNFSFIGKIRKINSRHLLSYIMSSLYSKGEYLSFIMSPHLRVGRHIFPRASACQSICHTRVRSII